jgi:hypothetical protein
MNRKFDANDRAIVLGVLRWHLLSVPEELRLALALEAAGGGSALAHAWVPEADVARFERDGWRVKIRTPDAAGAIARGAGAYMERG